jgi:hypothetical protein
MTAKRGAQRPFEGPDEDPLFYACFECPYPDCRFWSSKRYECPFRIRWGLKHGVDPEYLGGLKLSKRGRKILDKGSAGEV